MQALAACCMPCLPTSSKGLPCINAKLMMLPMFMCSNTVSTLRYNPLKLVPEEPGYGSGSGAPHVMLAYLKHIWIMGQRQEAYSRLKSLVGELQAVAQGRGAGPVVAAAVSPPPGIDGALGALGLVGTMPKWGERPRASLHGRAFLRLGLWQWSMSEVCAHDQAWFGKDGFAHGGLMFSTAPHLSHPPQTPFPTSFPAFPPSGTIANALTSLPTFCLTSLSCLPPFPFPPCMTSLHSICSTWMLARLPMC